MAKAPERASVRGPAFVRQLTRLTDVDVPHSNRAPALTDRLSQWFDWNRAVALSRALDGQPSTQPAEPAAGPEAQALECTRVRTALAGAIRSDKELSLSAPAQDKPAPPAQDAAAPVAVAVDFARLRRRYLEHQRAMQAATGRLRGHLRDTLAAQSVQQARLAEVDAVMELALSAREQRLLATVPDLLDRHFERLRDAAQQASTASDAPTPAASGPWLDGFRNDIQRLLLAELDVRFQPIEGLLAALRPQSPGPHV